MTGTPVTAQEDVEAYLAEIGNVRFRPLEVAGAASADAFPASYSFSLEMAGKIQELIRSW